MEKIEEKQFERTLKGNKMNFFLQHENKNPDKTFSEAGCVALLENIARWCEGKLVAEIKKSFRNKMALKCATFEVRFIKNKEVSMSQ